MLGSSKKLELEEEIELDDGVLELDGDLELDDGELDLDE